MSNLPAIPDPAQIVALSEDELLVRANKAAERFVRADHVARAAIFEGGVYLAEIRRRAHERGDDFDRWLKANWRMSRSSAYDWIDYAEWLLACPALDTQTQELPSVREVKRSIAASAPKPDEPEDAEYVVKPKPEPAPAPEPARPDPPCWRDELPPPPPRPVAQSASARLAPLVVPSPTSSGDNLTGANALDRACSAALRAVSSAVCVAQDMEVSERARLRIKTESFPLKVARAVGGHLQAALREVKAAEVVAVEWAEHAQESAQGGRAHWGPVEESA